METPKNQTLKILSLDDGDVQRYFWSTRPQPPYFTGKISEDFYGAFHSEESALDHLKNKLSRKGIGADFTAIERITLTPDNPDYWEHAARATYQLTFRLPLDELTEHLTWRDVNCPLVRSLLPDMKINFSADKAKTRITAATNEDKLQCMAIVPKPTDGAPPHVVMQLELNLSFSMRRPLNFRSLADQVIAGVTFPYYEDTFEGKLHLVRIY